MNLPSDEHSVDKQVGYPAGKVLLLVLLCAFILTLYLLWGDKLSIDFLAAQEIRLKEYQQQSPVLFYLCAFLLYVLVTGFSLPGAALLSLTYGWFFGLFPSLILVSLASTSGATIAFLLSRYFFHDLIRNRFGSHLERFNQSLHKEGAYYLFMLRLIPAVPFVLINLVMGVTPIRTSTFFWVSMVGMLPGTVVYLYAGSTLPSLQQLKTDGVSGILNIQTVIAFIILGLFPLLVKKLFDRKKGDSTESESNET